MAESQNIEWKESWRDEYLKWICGFANAQGGKIYIGCNDDGEIVGGVLYRCKGNNMIGIALGDGIYYLQRINIKPEHQNKGIAQKAILLCEKEFPDAKMFSVDFPEDLEKNRRCYEKAGFRDTGKRVEVQPGLVLAYFEKCSK